MTNLNAALAAHIAQQDRAAHPTVSEPRHDPRPVYVFRPTYDPARQIPADRPTTPDIAPQQGDDLMNDPQIAALRAIRQAEATIAALTRAHYSSSSAAIEALNLREQIAAESRRLIRSTWGDLQIMRATARAYASRYGSAYLAAVQPQE